MATLCEFTSAKVNPVYARYIAKASGPDEWRYYAYVD